VSPTQLTRELEPATWTTEEQRSLEQLEVTIRAREAQRAKDYRARETRARAERREGSNRRRAEMRAFDVRARAEMGRWERPRVGVTGGPKIFGYV
jgi:hypothetical protein